MSHAFLCGWSARASAQQESVFPDPGLTRPKLLFHTGRAVPGVGPEISPILPDIPGEPSGWFVTQWRKRQLLKPSMIQRNDPQTHDPYLGTAKWAFTTPNGESSVEIYYDHRQVTVGLLQRDGYILSVGGTDLFLSASSILPAATLDHDVTYDVALKLSDASALYNTQSAFASNSVLAQVFTSFILSFKPVGDRNAYTAFLQLHHADSRGIVPRFARCSINHNGSMELVFSSGAGRVPDLPFVSDAGPLHHLHYRLNDYVCEMLSRVYRCKDASGQYTPPKHLPDELRSLANWRILSMNVGIEGGNSNHRPGSTNTDPQGTIVTALDVADVKVMRSREKSFNSGKCSLADRYLP